MKIVSVINYKGGVGKTTLTANLGAYAASRNKRVLMIDLDPQASLTFSFFAPEYWRDKYADNKTLKNYFDPITKGLDSSVSLSSLTIPLNLTNPLILGDYKLDIISSHLDLIDVDIRLSSLINASNPAIFASTSLKTYSYLRNSLAEIKEIYDVVLIDCPPSFNIIVKNAIIASDYYIVPAKLDYLSTLGIERLKINISNYLEEYENHRKFLNTEPVPPVQMLGVVPIMVDIKKGDEPITAQQEYAEELTRKGYKIFQFVRNNGTVFGSMSKEKVPAVLTHPRFNITARRIVSELKELGEEFLSGINI